MNLLIVIFLCNIFSVYGYYSYSRKRYYKSVIKFWLPKKSILNMTPYEQVNYLTSIRDFTIITRGNSYRKIEDIMNENGLNVYYVNLDNMIDKDNILKYLEKQYKNQYTGEHFWVFYRGTFNGYIEDIDNIIQKRKNKFL